MRFIGIFFFVVLIFVTILFVEGYQVDPKTRDLVKKSVIYFDGVKAPSGDEISVKNAEISIFLDGKSITYTSPLELRVAPGAHDVVIASKKTFGWQKRIFVPEETVLRFPEIQLFPNAPDIFTKSLESIQSFVPQPGSDGGVFFIHPRLHFGKFYSFENPDAPWVKNIPFISKPSRSEATSLTPSQGWATLNLRLIPLSEDFWFGITAEGKLFSYDATLRHPTPRADFAVQDARLFGETLFVLDREGKIWKLREDDREPQFLFRIISPTSHIRHIEESNGRMMFLFDRLVAVAQDDGALLFQEPDVESATLNSDTIFYTKGTLLSHFDLNEKKVSETHVLSSSISFLSRIGKTYQFFFMNSALELFMCDPDYENCHSLGKTANNRIEVSKDRMRFFIERDGTLTLLDFEESDALPPFLQNLVSFATRAKLFE